MRDSQRSKVYKAERPILWPVTALPTLTQSEAQDFLNFTCRNRRVLTRFPRAGQRPPTIVFNARVRGANARRCGLITVQPSACNRLLLLHELAHVLAPVSDAHGRSFAETYLFLLRTIVGLETATKLQASFKACGVRFRPKSARKGNPAALRAYRLANPRTPGVITSDLYVGYLSMLAELWTDGNRSWTRGTPLYNLATRLSRPLRGATLWGRTP